MPISLNNTEYEPIPSVEQNMISALRQKVKTTKQMVDDALVKLHSAKGVTLKQIYTYILSTYALDIVTPNRISLIKKHLNELRELEEIINKTGKGFTGRLKLVDKEKFVRKLKENENQRLKARITKNTVNKGIVKTVKKTPQHISKTKSHKEPVTRKIQKPPIGSQEHTIVVPSQSTPVRAHRTNHNFSESMFDTPVVLSLLQHSTPCVESNIVPQAPDIRGKTNRKRVLQPPNEEDGGTPRSSLPGKKRKTQKRI